MPGSRWRTARAWPAATGCRCDALSEPVPAILEYIPYCKRDGTAARDEAMHPYFAGHGYAAIRVDLRGSGESEGVMLDEYLKQEQDDALEVIAWIAAQPWCTGRVGMMGKSWGGFNGAAGRRPPPAGAEGRDLDVLDRRPLRRRHPQHGRLPAERERELVVRDVSDERAAARSRCSSAPGWEAMWRQRLRRGAALDRRLAAAISVATPSGNTARSARTMGPSNARST